MGLFSGIGGIELGLQRAGFEILGVCEVDVFCQKILQQHFPTAEVFSDVKLLSKSHLHFKPDVVTGGFPCQDISTAGKGKGLSGERSGLWYQMFRVIQEVRPSWIIAENVPALRTRGADQVISDLEGEDYSVWPLVVGAWSVGAEHRRDRCWVIAHAKSQQILQLSETSMGSNAHGIRQPGSGKYQPPVDSTENPFGEASGFVHAFRQGTLPYVCGRHDGVSPSVDRIKALGNAVVPLIPNLIGRCILRIEKENDACHLRHRD